MTHWKYIIMNIIYKVISMADISLIMFIKLKYYLLVLNKTTSNFRNKILLNNFYKRMNWVPLGGMNLNDLNSLISI
jgi:hypothetical protein